MARQNKTDFKSTKNTQYADNTTQAITESTHRTVHENVADSTVFLDDEWPLAKKGPAPVRVALTANVDLDTEVEDGDVQDGVTLEEGDRFLAPEQTDPGENGIYVVQASGAAQRAEDFRRGDQESVFLGSEVYVQEGSTNAKKTFTLTARANFALPSVLGDLTFEELTPSGGGGGGANTKHILEYNTNLTTPQETIVDYTTTLTETLFGVSGVSYETSDDNGATFETKADIAAVNTELGTWSADGIVRCIVTTVTNTIGFVVLEET